MATHWSLKGLSTIPARLFLTAIEDAYNPRSILMGSPRLDCIRMSGWQQTKTVSSISVKSGSRRERKRMLLEFSQVHILTTA